VNIIEQARQAYAPTQIAIRTDRAIEAQLLGQITAKLRKTLVQSKVDFPFLVNAVYENRRLWATLAASVADADNQLPDQLRAQIFYLAEFSDHHGKLILQGRGDATPLIDINTAVMRGLNGQIEN
jgi:flagellar biosynthesis activator protein FlaF